MDSGPISAHKILGSLNDFTCLAIFSGYFIVNKLITGLSKFFCNRNKCGAMIHREKKKSLFIFKEDRKCYIFIWPIICGTVDFSMHRENQWHLILAKKEKGLSQFQICRQIIMRDSSQLSEILSIISRWSLPFSGHQSHKKYTFANTFES